MTERSSALPEKPVYLDTTGLWSLNGLFEPTKYAAPRWQEYLCYLTDSVCDPQKSVRCLMPSIQRGNLPLPKAYAALKGAGLLTDDQLAAQRSTPDVISVQFREFLRHITTHPTYMQTWFSLHDHPDVRDGWAKGIDGQSTRFEGVRAEVEDAVEHTDSDTLQQAERSCDLPLEKIVQMFSIVQRGHDYSIAVGDSSEYLTHPVRWQVIGLPTAQPSSVPSPAVLGGFVLGALEAGTLRADASALADALAGMRQNAAQHPFDLAKAKTTEEAMDMLRPVLVGALPGKLSDESLRWLRPLLVGAATIIGDVLDIPVAARVIFALLVKVDKGHVSAKTARFLRRYVEYPYLLNLPVKGCSVCGAPLDDGRCRVCQLRRLAGDGGNDTGAQQERPADK